MIAQLVVEKNRNPVRVFLLNKQIPNTGDVWRLTATFYREQQADADK